MTPVALANHLWQSTLFVVAIGVMSLLLRKNQARVRYWLWLTASVKFLVPFSLLVAVGGHLGRSATAPIAQPAFSVVVEQISQPFAQAAHGGAVASDAHRRDLNYLPAFLLVAWASGFLVVFFSWSRRWWRIRAVLRMAAPLPLGTDVPVLSAPGLLEPGVFGIVRPVLLLPEGITDRLEPSHLMAIIAHELCHVRRRDNLAAMVHMGVEAIFWFHPLVWWLGARLVEERERACDEEVLRLGSAPEVYAESILKTCQFYLESPLVCVSGITGSDLKARIVRIMTQGVAENLSLSKKILLAAAGMAAVAGPLVFGILNAAPSRAQMPEPAGPRPAFEVASIKPSDPSARGTSQRIAPGGRYTAQNITVRLLIEHAYNIRDFQLSGGPDWVNSARYDIVAKAEDPSDEDPRTLTGAQREAFRQKLQQRLQSLLEERFQLKFHNSTKELPTCALVVGKSGPKLQKAKDTVTGPMRTLMMRPGNFTAHAISTSLLAASLSNMLAAL